MKSVFISSTFRDMQIERDALHTRVFPLLNEQAAEYSEVFTGIDLRWGIQTSLLSEEEADKKAFLTCFDEIDSSRPYFIAFIGDRYGTNVDEKSISRIFNLILNKDKMTKIEVDEFIKKTSITQKEIEYATFISKIAPSNCFFFFRKGYGKVLTKDEEEIWIENDKESKEKLDNLKNQIKKRYPNSFYEYSLDYSEEKGFFLPESEIKRFVDYLSKTFLKHYKKKKYSQHDALKQQMSFFSKERDFGFFGRKKDYDALEKFLKNEEDNILILKGPSGLGKTSLLSHLIESEKKNYIFVPIFIGTTPSFMNEKGILKYLYESVLENNGESINLASDYVVCDEADFKNVAPEAILSVGIKNLLSLPFYVSKKPMVIILDSLNTVHGSPYLENLDFLPIYGLGDRIKIIISTTDDSSLSLYKCAASGLAKYELAALKKEDIKTISYNVLSKVFHKESSDKMIGNIAKKKNSFEPLYLSLLLRRLLLVNRYDFDNIYRDTKSEDARYNYLEKLILDEADLSEELAASLFKKVIEFSNAQFLSTAFSYIALSPYGLTIQDLEELIPEFDESDFYIAIRFLEPLFYRDEQGRISFSHERIKNSVRSNNESINRKATKRLINFFKQKGDARYNERVSLVFDNYSADISVIQDLLEEEKEKDTSPLVFNYLFSKLVEEFEKSEDVLFDYLYKSGYLSILSKLLMRIINETRLENIDNHFVLGLFRHYQPVEDEDVLSTEFSVFLGLNSLMLMIFKAKNIYDEDLEDSLTKDLPLIILKREIDKQTFPTMCSFFTICCFKYFGVSSYGKDFVDGFIHINETLGPDYAIYHLITKELLLLDEPENVDRTFKLENLLGEAYFIKNNGKNNFELERFMNRLSLVYLFNYYGPGLVNVFGLASDVLFNADHLLYIEKSYSYQRNIAKIMYASSEAARIHVLAGKVRIFENPSQFSKRTFLLSYHLASCFLDEDSVELAIDSLQNHLDILYLEGVPITSRDLKRINSLVQDYTNKNGSNPVINAKLQMIQGFVAINNNKYEEGERLYRLAISYFKDKEDYYCQTVKAHAKLLDCLKIMFIRRKKDSEIAVKFNIAISELFDFVTSIFERGLLISHYDCEEIKNTIDIYTNFKEKNDGTYETKKIRCYLSYCSYYQTNSTNHLREAYKCYTMIDKYFQDNSVSKKEISKFFSTIKKYDPHNLVVLSCQGISREDIKEFDSIFKNTIDEKPYEALRLLITLDRGGMFYEQLGDFRRAKDLYEICWDYNNKLIQKYESSFKIYKECLISIEAYNRMITTINGYPDVGLCMNYLICFGKVLIYTPFRSQKLSDKKQKSLIELAFKTCLGHKEYYEYLSFVIDSMDKYYSDSMNFESKLEYECQYVLYSYYRLLFGYLTENQEHITKGYDDLIQSFVGMFFDLTDSLRRYMDDAELAALVTFSSMFKFEGPEEMAEAYYNLSQLYPEALASDAIARIEFE